MISYMEFKEKFKVDLDIVHQLPEEDVDEFCEFIYDIVYEEFLEDFYDRYNQAVGSAVANYKETKQWEKEEKQL